MPYAPILATLGYVLDGAGRVLMVRRDRRPNDHHYGKVNGLGGKLEPGEDVVAGMKREIREEAGLECLNLRLRGTINWPGFGKNGEDWFAFIFVIDRWQGTPAADNEEGKLLWTSADRLLELPLWEGDRFFLPLVFDESVRQFHGVMPYKNGKPLSWNFHTLSCQPDAQARVPRATRALLLLEQW